MSDTLQTKQTKTIIWIILPVILLMFFLMNISLGSVNIPLNNIIDILIGKSIEKDAWANIILQFRLPKAMTAILVGAGLSVSGLLMQTLFRNPLAGPFVLGITSGASLGVALLVLATATFGGIFTFIGTSGNWMMVLAASFGAGLVLMLVLVAATRVKNSMTLLIIGLMFGSATGAIVSILQFFSSKEQIQSYLIWTFGSVGGLTWREINIFLPIICIGLVAAFLLKKPLNALLLGEDYAQSMGVKIKSVRFMVIVVTSILAGTITAFCGPIAFIGITVPHLCRMIFSTSNHNTLIIASILIGSIIMLFCDIVAQLPGSQFVLPINAVTSLLGAPMVVWIILRKKNIMT